MGILTRDRARLHLGEVSELAGIVREEAEEMAKRTLQRCRGVAEPFAKLASRIAAIRYVQSIRLPGETLWDAFRRDLVVAAFEESGRNQRRAAEVLGIPPARMNYYARQLRLRPKDERTESAESA